MVDLPPALSVERIFGEGIPEPAASQFRGEPNEFGHFEWMDVTSCPLSQVDSLSPRLSASWLVDVYDAAAGIAAKLPAHWQIPDPTPLMIQAVITLKSEGDSAQYFRTENNEDW